jgi:acetylornithine/succinyldiaminopimelate/putrescine aminotransferase
VTRILHRQIGHSYPVAVSAHGITIRDGAGKEYIDASGGAAVSCLGSLLMPIRASSRRRLQRSWPTISSLTHRKASVTPSS